MLSLVGFTYNEALSPCVPCVFSIYDNFDKFVYPHLANVEKNDWYIRGGLS